MTDRSEEITIRALLDDLQSEDTYSRNNTIKRIITQEIRDQRIVDALLNLIINDPSLSVRNFARNALDALGIEHSPMEDDQIDYAKGKYSAQARARNKRATSAKEDQGVYTKVKSSDPAGTRDKNARSSDGIMIAIIVIILLCILFGIACFNSI